MHRALFGLCSFVVACTPKNSPSTSPSTGEQTQPAQLELLGMMQTVDGLTLQVRSGGCRDKTDVAFTVVEDALVITTLESDTCEAKIPLGETLQFPWAELPAFRELGFTPGPAPVLEPGTTPGATTAPADARDEEIFGVLVTPDGLDIRVWSSGCTGPDSFTTWIEVGEDAELIHLVRTKLDRCEAEQPEGALLHFTWAQLGVTKARARLVNPIWKLPVR